jgi:hypothetical protein
MVDAMGSHASGRELAALGRADGPSPLLDEGNVTVMARRREADALRRPASPAAARRERPRRARSRIRAREHMGATI